MWCQDIIEALEKHSPACYAENWDNVGLLAGRRDKKVEKVLVAVDATDEVVRQAVESKVDLLITHHPLIFKGQKRVTMDDMVGRRLMSLIQADISYYAMHTNFDIMGMAQLSADKLQLIKQSVLEVTAVDDKGREEGIGRKGILPKCMTLKEFAEYVKKSYDLEYVIVSGDKEMSVQSVAVSTGSGKHAIPVALEAGVQVLVTGDVDHHSAIDAVADGLAIIDAGHYGTEKMFVPYVKQYLQKEFESICIEEAREKSPFYIV